MILFYSFGLISYVNYEMSGTVYLLLFYYFLWDFILALINVSVVRLIWGKKQLLLCCFAQMQSEVSEGKLLCHSDDIGSYDPARCGLLFIVRCK